MKDVKKRIKSILSIIVSVNILQITSWAYAAEVNLNDMMLENMISDGEEFIDEMNHYLETQNTNVIEQLQIKKIKLESEAKSEMNLEIKMKLLDLVNVYEECIKDYQTYIDGSNARGFHPILSAEVAAVIAYFDIKGYALSSELLAHARDNTTVDSYYQPVRGWEASRSSVINNIRNSSALYGSASFEQGSGEFDNDLYYAIHNFDWYKESGRILIRDRYDYEKPQKVESLAQVAIGEMKKAQDAGVIVPFYTNIYVPK